MRANNGNMDCVSKRCHLYNGCFTDQQIRHDRGWIETPKKFHCNGIRGVCMIMGALVCVFETGGSISYQEIVPRKSMERNSEVSHDAVVWQTLNKRAQFHIPSKRLRQNIHSTEN